MTTTSLSAGVNETSGRAITSAQDRSKRGQSPRAVRQAAPALTPCFGKWELFDSTDIVDHQAAKRLCDACLVIQGCASRLLELQRTHGSYEQPEGTWAGRLMTNEVRANRLSRDDRLREKYDAEEAAYTSEQAREASRAYMAGDRGPWATTGRRVHDRRKRREARKKVA